MNISQLNLFVKIVETGSFTKAGELLHMSQPAVSRAISTLESELGVTLLIRERRNGVIHLTDIGTRLLVMFREILNGVNKVEQEVTAEKGFEVGTIRVGVFPMVSAHFLPKIMRIIGEKHPGLAFELFEGTIEEIKHGLESRIIDVGWIIPPCNELETIPFFCDELCLVHRDDHPLQSRETIHITDLDNEPMIVCQGGFVTPIIEIFKEFGTTLYAKYNGHNINTALSMIQEGLGISIVSRTSLSLSSIPPNVRIRTIDPQPVREIHLAVPSLKESSHGVKLFLRTARELYLSESQIH
ncbi:LysR family transcriptional regulator [Paenibacillus amylolyticus]|uniref:LysR family transcriptional regulator n=1 Tax=Paenibacillus amylolyticus TaxID=1451 RepID=UPI00201DCCEC|nr:LysR family transcriptional regulator [Paenibacillus amylolyticus]MCL6663903.1 LysR family transcriptional regulator [Paenibacillus amylolyticus]UOK61290.1 LysR family transcriptional regulator [Paenibacillus sp. OVF10]